MKWFTHAFAIGATLSAAAAGLHAAAADHREDHSQRVLTPRSAPSGGVSQYDPKNPDKCPQSNLVGVVQVHLTGTLLDNWANGKYTCSGCITQGTLSSAALNDDDGTQGAVIPPPDNIPSNLTRTPFDIDLSTLWGTGTVLKSAVLIKFLLEDSRFSFITQNGLTSNSGWAVVPGATNSDMFSCRGVIVPAKSNVGGKTRPYPYFVIRATMMGDEQPNFGGLNIGVSVPASNGTSIPFYIDPIIHNNG